MDVKNLITAADRSEIVRAWNMVHAASKITLLTHYNPDGDGVSACAALDHILRKLGKIVETVYPSLPKVEIKRQPAKVLINCHEQQPDLIIMCDTANYDRLYYPEQFVGVSSINIDHHIGSTINPTINFLDGTAPSTCDYLYRLLTVIDSTVIDQFVAECLLYGILSDTQSFSIQGTSAQVLRIGADLIEKGIDYYSLAQELMYRKKFAEVKFWGEMLARAQTNATESVVWTVVKQQDLKAAGLSLTSIAGFENFIAQLSIAPVTILFYEDDRGKSKASFRSKRLDVNAVAKQFGGGGHKLAAGLTSDESLESLVPKIVACFEKCSM